MRFVQFRLIKDLNNLRVGLQKKTGGVVDITESLPGCRSLVEALNKVGVDHLRESARANLANQDLPSSKYKLISPITSPDKLACVGLNYKDTCKELGAEPRSKPLLFSKFSSAIAGPFDDIILSDITQDTFWEAELAVVIGKKGRNIDADKAKEHVFGYSIANDLTSLAWHKKNGGQWLLGKTIDGFCPMGPCIVTTDKIPDPHNLNISCKVNGEVKQQSNTNQLVHNVYECVAYLSRFCTLLPGDVILTGTPPGSGGFAKPPQFLKKGDVVECEIQGIGSIKNKFV